jgi:hypothetical protein
MEEDAKRLVLMGLVTLWAVCWGLSVYAFATGEAGVGGPGGGSPRMAAALGWQLAALLPAFAAWAVGRQWPADSGVRQVARAPLRLSLGLAAVIGGLVLWSSLRSVA